MPEFRINILISKPIDIVYQAYVDPDNMLKWSTDLVKFEIVKGSFGEVGALAHAHYNQKGRIYILEDRLEYIEPGNKIISQVAGNGLKIRVETHFKSHNEESELEILWNGTGTHLILKILLPFLKKMIKKQAQSELEKFKNLVEEYGLKF